jgi:predicted transcriptional regulator of viral defense system
MAWKKHAARDTAAWDLVRGQHGVVARRQLMAIGYTRREIEQRLHNGRLHHISHGVYAVGQRELTPHGRWMAAALVCGEQAALSHRSAAELWGIGYEEQGRIDVTIRRRSMIRRAGIKVRARPALGAGAVVHRFGIPVTHPVQTLIDVATELKPLRLERAVNEADKLDLVDPETLRKALDGYGGCRALRPCGRCSTGTRSGSPTPTTT